MTDETQRILAEYGRRESAIPKGFYSHLRAGELFMYQSRTRAVTRALHRLGFEPETARVLDVGCGGGAWLLDFESWGVPRANLAGIELEPKRCETAQARLCAQRDADGTVLRPGADVRHGNATDLPWPDGAFDLVLQATVFTSILDAAMKTRVAAEMRRVLAPGGAILWYDFWVDNRKNPNVKGVPLREIRALFPACRIRARRITLAPPISRRLAPVSVMAAMLAEYPRLLNTHFLAVIEKAG